VSGPPYAPTKGMSIPLQITYRDMPSTPTLDGLVHSWLAKLEHLHDRVERCHVLVERPHQHHRRGQEFRVKVTLTMPGPDVVVSREHGDHDARVAVREAFLAARRQLQAHAA